MTNILTQSVFSLIACTAYSVVCNAPRKELLYCGLNGFLGWFVYMLVLVWKGEEVMATLLATMAVTAVARFLSCFRWAPSILYHIPGVLPLVPGAAVYHTMTAAIQGHILATYSNALLGFKLAGAIGIGSLLVLVIPNRVFLLAGKLRRNKGDN